MHFRTAQQQGSGGPQPGLPAEPTQDPATQMSTFSNPAPRPIPNDNMGMTSSSKPDFNNQYTHPEAAYSSVLTSMYCIALFYVTAKKKNQL